MANDIRDALERTSVAELHGRISNSEAAAIVTRARQADVSNDEILQTAGDLLRQGVLTRPEYDVLYTSVTGHAPPPLPNVIA